MKMWNEQKNIAYGVSLYFIYSTLSVPLNGECNKKPSKNKRDRTIRHQENGENYKILHCLSLGAWLTPKKRSVMKWD